MGLVFLSGVAAHTFYRMLKKAAICVLASNSEPQRTAQNRLYPSEPLSLAAALLDDLFDHPQARPSLLYFQTASGFSFATGFPPLMCSSMIVATSASVTLEYQVASG